ncbi:MAG TPA: NifB/NifX family molybdenum-iron cluster-binding protein [Spirochaetia bacterium]|nr:NifB/NifX family molybdenum-iron cluster-binding protein [Spirochaetia bacterium]
MSRIAVAIWQGHVATTLDFAGTLLLVDVQDGTITAQSEVGLEESAVRHLAGLLGGRGIQTVICGAISRPLLRSLQAGGIRVVPFVRGEAQEVLAAFLDGTLEDSRFLMAGCAPGARRTVPEPKAGVVGGAIPAPERIWLKRRSPMPGRDGTGGEQRSSGLRVAIPLDENRLSAHFGHGKRFALMDVDTEAKLVLSRQDFDAPEHVPGAFPRWLAANGAQLVIAGTMGANAQRLLAQAGIQVLMGAPVETPEELVGAYLEGKLRLEPAPCDHGGGHHDADGSTGSHAHGDDPRR